MSFGLAAARKGGARLRRKRQQTRPKTSRPCLGPPTSTPPRSRHCWARSGRHTGGRQPAWLQSCRSRALGCARRQLTFLSADRCSQARFPWSPLSPFREPPCPARRLQSWGQGSRTGRSHAVSPPRKVRGRAGPRSAPAAPRRCPLPGGELMDWDIKVDGTGCPSAGRGGSGGPGRSSGARRDAARPPGAPSPLC